MSTTLPTFDPPVGMNAVALFLHVMDVQTHECVNCGESPIWDTYAEYVDHFYANEWEGERSHVPDEEEQWEYINSTCLAVVVA